MNHAQNQRCFGSEHCPHIPETNASYDSQCAYCVKLVDRFKKHFPDKVPLLQKYRFLIPLLHVNDHKDDCLYEFACSYMVRAGHFHGETAEHMWVELNQVANFVRQMNNGHRQDTVIRHINHWNTRKIARMGKFECSQMPYLRLTQQNQVTPLLTISTQREHCTGDIKIIS